MTTTERPVRRTISSPSSADTAESLPAGFAWTIVELAPDGILVSDEDGVILMANGRVETLFGHDHDTLVGTHIERLVPHGLRLAHDTQRDGAVAAATPRPMGVGLDLLGCHANGSEFPIEISVSPVATDHGVASVVIIRDLSQQRLQEDGARATTIADEDERIGTVMHDRVIGLLFASGLNIAAVLSANQLDHHATGRLRDVVGELDAAIREIRTAIFQHLDPAPDTPRAA